MVTFLRARPGAVIRSTVVKAGLVVLTLAIALGIQGTMNDARAEGPGPSCLQVLASFFAHADGPGDGGRGLKTELEGAHAIASAFNIQVGTVISRLAHEEAPEELPVTYCLDVFFNGGTPPTG